MDFIGIETGLYKIIHTKRKMHKKLLVKNVHKNGETDVKKV